MHKGLLLKWLNICLLAVFGLLVCTVLFRDIPPGRLFFDVHPWVGRVLILLIIIHIIMNWNWIRTSILKR